MTNAPKIHCDAWEDGKEIPIEYTAPRGANIQPPASTQPENRQPHFTFTNIPEGTKAIALVVHDVLDGDEDEDGNRPGWTHWTALVSESGEVLKNGKTDTGTDGWVGPYPAQNGQYHCTAYFLSETFPDIELTRANILEVFENTGLGFANMIGTYINPQAKANDTHPDIGTLDEHIAEAN